MLSIAESKGHNTKELKGEMKKLSQKYQIERIKKYKDYRNKMGSHYDMEALDQLKLLNETEKMEFAKILEAFVGYAFDWHEFLWQEIRSTPSKPEPV